MVRFVPRLVCAVSLFLSPLVAQTTALEPLRYPSGAVLDFHLQTRFYPDAANPADLLPKGTILRVKLLSPVDSDVALDGTEIRGVLTATVFSGDKVVVHSDAEAHLLFVVLRSPSHPQGFRYELLVTKIVDAGKPLDLTASLNSSFADGSSTPPPEAKPAADSSVGTGHSGEITKLSAKGGN